ncbi:hypothetical protein FALBO_3540 [Fusarium albosuccineum]|uniref:Major facilitator superfamily (MFS) profile domain-containing protein n=1 Tax=Fusarium albosuccineum TaxID=1237068 RepID=A0A8H4PEH7_9HYPO|nr:hypothetical protein FALBO_3540 [Fusarium albosuccineum]
MGFTSDSLEPVKTGDKHDVSTQEHVSVPIDSDLEPYGPAGFRGLFSSPYVALCAAFAAIGGLLFGYDQGVISVTLVMDHFLNRFPEVSDDAPGAGFKKGLMTAMITLGAFIGAINQGWVADWASRKRSIMIAVVIFSIGSALQTAALNFDMLVAGRFIGGVGIGMLSMVVPLYIALFVVLGIIVAFWITYATKDMDSHWSWQLPFLLQIFPGLVLGFGAIFLPFSPRWLASKGREEEALENLVKLRRLPETDRRVQREWIEIIAEARFQAGVLVERHPALTAPENKTISAAIKLEIQFIGINALIYYSPTLFGTMGLDLNMQLIMSGVLNIIQLIGVFSSLWTLDRFGRKTILLAGSVLTVLPLVIIAVMVGLFSDSWPTHRAEGWTSVAFLLFYMLVFGGSWAPTPWAVPAEVFPSSLRAKGVAISTCSNWINNFIIGLITPLLVQATGFGAYVFFAVFGLLSFAFVWFYVPETRGKTLEEMEQWC